MLFWLYKYGTDPDSLENWYYFYSMKDVISFAKEHKGEYNLCRGEFNPGWIESVIETIMEREERNIPFDNEKVYILGQELTHEIEKALLRSEPTGR